MFALNVNGLQSKLNLGILENYIAESDIECLTETLCESPALSLLRESLLNSKTVIVPKNKRKEDWFAATDEIVIFIKLLFLSICLLCNI